MWTDNAKSYLMDTIIRGKPIPKVFMRQILNTTTKKSVREVVDGQQRLRTIIAYIEDGFQINPKHNSEYGGLYFSQLSEKNDIIQGTILNYEIAVDLLVNMPDSEILDVFSRLNAYAVVLNEQERLNADHFGPFKMLSDGLGHKYYEFWVNNRVLTESGALRMGDVALAADLLIATIEGIRGKEIKKYYDLYEREFVPDIDILAEQFDQTMAVLAELVSESLRNSEYRRVSLFYSLFCAVFHGLFGLKDFNQPRANLAKSSYSRIRSSLEEVDEVFGLAETDQKKLLPDQVQFVEDSRRATTDTSRRIRRTIFINNLLLR